MIPEALEDIDYKSFKDCGIFWGGPEYMPFSV